MQKVKCKGPLAAFLGPLKWDARHLAFEDTALNQMEAELHYRLYRLLYERISLSIKRHNSMLEV